MASHPLAAWQSVEFAVFRSQDGALKGQFHRERIG